MCVRDGISRLAMRLSLLTGLTSFGRARRLRHNDFQFVRKQKSEQEGSTIKCCWKVFIQPYLGTILCLRLLFRNQLFSSKPSEFLLKSLLVAELSLFISLKAQFCALRHTTLCLRTIFAHQHFHSEKFFIFRRSVLPSFALQRILNQNWIKLKPFCNTREQLVKILPLTKLFSASSSQHSQSELRIIRATKIHVREQRKPSIEWTEPRKSFPNISARRKILPIFSLFSPLAAADASALITENGTQSFPFACRKAFSKNIIRGGRTEFVFHS